VLGEVGVYPALKSGFALLVVMMSVSTLGVMRPPAKVTFIAATMDGASPAFSWVPQVMMVINIPPL